MGTLTPWKLAKLQIRPFIHPMEPADTANWWERGGRSGGEGPCAQSSLTHYFLPDTALPTLPEQAGPLPKTQPNHHLFLGSRSWGPHQSVRSAPALSAPQHPCRELSCRQLRTAAAPFSSWCSEPGHARPTAPGSGHLEESHVPAAGTALRERPHSIRSELAAGPRAGPLQVHVPSAPGSP